MCMAPKMIGNERTGDFIFMTWQEFEQQFSIQLNEQQKSAVQSVDGPVLLLAVPGSGKTTVLVTRLGYMIYCKGMNPGKILTVTYTVAATKDMADRFAVKFGQEMAERLEFRTINGICARVIQYYSWKTGRMAFQLLTDEKRITAMLSGIYQQTERVYPTEGDLKNVRALITYIKNRMLNEKEIQNLEEEAEIHLAAIYKEYCRQLREQQLMDYDDQMVYAYNMLRKIPELLFYFQEKYPYICVDEAQDTSKIQHAIIALLASKSENLFMVGDEDQSIYGFRAAYPEALLEFEQHHPGAKVLLMEENFRSDGNIVLAADRFIQKNTLRHEKHMRPSKERKQDVKEISVGTRKAQYSYLVKVAEGCTTQTAVLYPEHECVLPLIDLLERRGISYRMRNVELTFFTHRVVQDISNIIKLAADQKNTDLFLLVYYKLNTYIRKQDALQIAELSREKNLSVWETALSYEGLDGYAKGNIKSVATHMEHLLTEPASRAIHRIVQFMGYQDYLKRSEIKDTKLDTLKMLASLEETPLRLVERLNELRKFIEKKEQDQSCPFILSTIHASKGLEYDTVYLLDVVDGILPDQIPVNLKTAPREELETYEEERRLFYVGATRAKNRLFLFTMKQTSSFCDEFLGQAAPKKRVIPATAGNIHLPEADTKAAAPKALSDSEFQKFMEQLAEGVMVTHKIFGQGVVVELNEKKIRVDFDGEVKTFSSRVLAGSGMLRL